MGKMVARQGGIDQWPERAYREDVEPGWTVNKNGLVAEVSKRTGASKADVGRAIDASMDVVREAVSRGERVARRIRDVRTQASRNRRSPGTHGKPETPIVVPARDLPWFTPGKDFREMASKRRRATSRR